MEGTIMKKYYIISMICIFVILIFSIGTAAADSNINSQETILQHQQQRLAEQNAQEQNQRRTQEKFISNGKSAQHLEKIKLPKENVSFLIKTFTVNGPYAQTKFKWIKKYLEQYANEKIGTAGIDLLLNSINEEIIARGYVTTKAYVTAQDLTSGVLTINIQAGTIDNIYFTGKTWGTWKNAFPMRHGDLLNVHDLDQGLEQMQRVSSQNVAVNILPAQKPGQSDIEITVKRTKPWKAVFSADDSGLSSTGKLQLSTGLEMDNLFSVNDILNISFNEDGEKDGQNKGTRANSIYYAVPLGRQTLSFSAYTYDYHQKVRTAINPFMSSGAITAYDLGITRLLDRDQKQKTNLELHLLRNRRHSYINNTEIGVQRQNTTAVQIGVTHKKYIGKSVLDAALFYQRGVGWLGAQPGASDNISGGPTTKYNMYLFNLNWNAPLKIGRTMWQYNLEAKAQYTKNLLYGSDFFGIGGRYSVRGFDGEQTLSAENGLVLRNELRLPIYKDQQLYAALDYGKVSGPSAAYLLGRELVGTALGIRGTVKNVQYDIFIGWPLSKPKGFDTPARTGGFSVSVHF